MRTLALILMLGAAGKSNAQMSAKDIYELNAKCSTEAERYFKEYYYSPYTTNPTVTFKNHYNQKLNKCLIQVEILGNKPAEKRSWHTTIITDVQEKVDYGSMLSDWRDGVYTLTFCQVSGNKCVSEGDFSDKSSPLMTQ
jgi:hypothetical protein